MAHTDLALGIRALPNTDNTTDNGINSAILRYAGANITNPTTRDTSGRLPLIETNLHVCPFFF
jgi:iron transport multicopper oxidase